MPVLRSHVHPHLVVYNLMDKMLSDKMAMLHLNGNFSDEVSDMLRDILEVYTIWTDVRLPRASRFYVDLRHALCPGFQVCIDPSDGLADWDIPGIRDYKLASSPRSKAILQKLEDLEDSEGSWSSLGSHDSGNGGEERFPHSLDDDKVWADEIRAWQSSSAIADPYYYDAWTEPEGHASPPVQSMVPTNTTQDEEGPYADLSEYWSYLSSS